MKRTILIILLLVPSLLSAQHKPDNEIIFREINNGLSKHLYSSLFARYNAMDTTLTADDYYYLYYGYAFSEKYKPFDPIPESDLTFTVAGRDDEPDPVLGMKLLQHTKNVAKIDPFSPSNLNFMSYAYALAGDTVSATKNTIRVRRILETIKHSGTGLREDSPWCVLWFSHVNDVLTSMELQVNKRTVISREVEYVNLVKRDDRIKGYYFDFSRIYWNKPDRLQEKKRSVEFNGINIK